MGALRERMLSNMHMRNFSPRTIYAYLWHVTEFTRYFGKSPDLLGEEHARQYVSYLCEERKKSWSNINVCHSALKFFYSNTLHRDWQVKMIPRPKGERRLPVVLDHGELSVLFSATANWKHQLILKLIYSAGLRLSEAAHLKVQHIESSSMRIRVEQGKGKRDRYTVLSQQVLDGLRDYWLKYRPKEWLFFGAKKSRPIHVSTIQVAFRAAKKKPVLINQSLSTHCAIALQPTFWSKALTF
ncbi:MAG: tyrosine-type recombinase/integrase [Oceanicoccus sp.]|nr:tyrosine-type recombinase/integrase [Oceanicoccus sp.]